MTTLLMFPFPEHSNFSHFRISKTTNLIPVYNKDRADTKNAFRRVQSTHALAHTQQCRDFVDERVAVKIECEREGDGKE